MSGHTNGLSFILKPSTIDTAGVGVFALHDIAKDTYMELFLTDFQEETHNKKDIPKELQGYCLNQADDKLLCPKFFNRMDIGNYVNHSENPNVRYEKGKGYFTIREIKKGEEILGNYREPDEPIETRDYYYR